MKGTSVKTNPTEITISNFQSQEWTGNGSLLLMPLRLGYLFSVIILFLYIPSGRYPSGNRSPQNLILIILITARKNKISICTSKLHLLSFCNRSCEIPMNSSNYPDPVVFLLKNFNKTSQ